MTWKLAPSLVVLREQINELFPQRDKTSDGTIGDSKHSSRTSDHNPDKNGIVCAFDIDVDLANGVDAHQLADHIRVHRHPALKYIISNGRIASAVEGWKWRPYTGTNPHDKHIHISVYPHNNTTRWNLGAIGEEKMTGVNETQVKQIHRSVFGIEPNANGYSWVGKTLDQYVTFLSNDPASLRNRLLAGATLKIVDGKVVDVTATSTPKECPCDEQKERITELEKILTSIHELTEGAIEK